MPSDAFSASYSDWKLIRTRGVVQIVLEVPIEAADHAYNVLGGMPNSASEVWVGVARFKPGTEVMPAVPKARPEKPPASEDSATPARARKSWHEMTPAQQAGVLCNEMPFYSYLYNRHNTLQSWKDDADAALTLVESCARLVRHQ